MNSVHICDPQLVGVGGHYRNHDIQLVSEIQKRGLPVFLYASKNCTTECCGIIPEKIFDLDIFHEVGQDPLVWPMQNFHYGNAGIARNLSCISLSKLSCEDIVYFPNLLQNQLLGIAEWQAGLPQANRPRVAVMLRWLNHAMGYISLRTNKELIPLLYRFAGGVFLDADPRNSICVDTRELKHAYEAIIGRQVLELPNPMDVSEGLQLARGGTELQEKVPVIVYQGHTSPLRGFHFLPDILNRCLGAGSRADYKIQIAAETGGPELRETIQRLLAIADKHSNVQLLWGSLSRDEWVKLLNLADIILLPYSPDFYGHGSSGVFTEAVSLEKVVVVSPNTMPAREGTELDLGVVIASEWAAAALADALLEALRDLPFLKCKASAAAEAFRRENSAKTLWDRLLCG